MPYRRSSVRRLRSWKAVRLKRERACREPAQVGLAACLVEVGETHGSAAEREVAGARFDEAQQEVQLARERRAIEGGDLVEQPPVDAESACRREAVTPGGEGVDDGGQGALAVDHDRRSVASRSPAGGASARAAGRARDDDEPSGASDGRGPWDGPHRPGRDPASCPPKEGPVAAGSRTTLRDIAALVLVAVACPAAFYGGALVSCATTDITDCAARGTVFVSPLVLVAAGVIAGVLTSGWPGLGFVYFGVIAGLATIPFMASASGNPVPIDPFSGIFAMTLFTLPAALGYGIARGIARILGRSDARRG